MIIQRIETMSDCPHADPRYVAIHNAYLVDDIPVYFEFIEKCKAVIHSALSELPKELVEEFRFYNYQVTEFYGENGELLFSYPPIPLTLTEISSLQPSQFYINQAKMQNCEEWVSSADDLLIPVYPDTPFICDGHTRLSAGLRNGVTHCYTYPADGVGSYLSDFIQMAKERGIFKISDMKVVSDEEYRIVWHQFCDEYFRNRNSGKNADA